MRWLVTAVVVMGVLIVAATGVLVATLVARFHVPARHAAVAAAAPATLRLAEPAGTRIAAVAALGGRLVLTLRGGGPDRLLVIDPASGRVGLRVALAP